MENPDKHKLRSKLIGPYKIITINEKYNSCRAKDKNSKCRGLHMDSLRFIKSYKHQKTSKFEIPSITIEKFGACSIDNILPKNL